ncbi:unnamed protein product [Amoebophrya sp. A120]|nr:unnamed protein product [Amoebophrya sp. A120]|eukprot:GSA120T00022654001.1
MPELFPAQEQQNQHAAHWHGCTSSSISPHQTGVVPLFVVPPSSSNDPSANLHQVPPSSNMMLPAGAAATSSPQLGAQNTSCMQLADAQNLPLRDVLLGSVSGVNQSLRQYCNQILKQKEETDAQFCLQLLEIYHLEKTDYTLKFLALTGCKNVLLRNWGYRGPAPSARTQAGITSRQVGPSLMTASGKDPRNPMSSGSCTVGANTGGAPPGTEQHKFPPAMNGSTGTTPGGTTNTAQQIYFPPELKARIKAMVLQVFERDVGALCAAENDHMQQLPVDRKRCIDTLIILVRKISRFSFPKDYPELPVFFNNFFQNFLGQTAEQTKASQLPDIVVNARRLVCNKQPLPNLKQINEAIPIFLVVQLFFCVLKEQSLKMLLADKSAFHKVGQELLHMFGNFFIAASRAVRLLLDSPLNLKTLADSSSTNAMPDPRWHFPDADPRDQATALQYLSQLGIGAPPLGVAGGPTGGAAGAAPPILGSSSRPELSQPDRERLWKLRKYLSGSMMILLEKGFVHLTDLVEKDPQLFIFFRDELGHRLIGLHLTNVRYQLNFDLANLIPFLHCLKGFLKRWGGLLKQHPLALMEADVARCLELNVKVLEVVYQELHPVVDVNGTATSNTTTSSPAPSLANGANTTGIQVATNEVVATRSTTPMTQILVLKNLPGGQDDYFRLLSLLLTVARRAVEGMENPVRNGWRNQNQNCAKLKHRAVSCFDQFTNHFLQKYPVFPKLCNLVAHLCLKMNVVLNNASTDGSTGNECSEFSPAVLLKDALEEQDDQQLEDDQQLLTGPAQASEVRQAGEKFLAALCMHENYRRSLSTWIESLTAKYTGGAASASATSGGGVLLAQHQPGQLHGNFVANPLELTNIEEYDMTLSVLSVCQSLFKKVSQDRDFHEKNNSCTPVLAGQQHQPGVADAVSIRSLGPKTRSPNNPESNSMRVNLNREREFLASVFQQILPILKPAISLYNQKPPQEIMGDARRFVWHVVLPVRVSYFFRAWANDLPPNEVPAVLEVLSQFLQNGWCKLIRVSILSPLEDIYSRHSDHPIWEQIQAALSEALVLLLREVTNPTTQWRCLSLVRKILEEGVGGCEAKAQMLQTLLGLWRAEQTQLMVRMALLELVQTIVQQYQSNNLLDHKSDNRNKGAANSSDASGDDNVMIEQLLEVSLVMLGDCYRNLDPAKADTPTTTNSTTGGPGSLQSGKKEPGVKSSAVPTVKECKLLFLTVLRSPLLNRRRQEQWLQALMPISSVLDRDLFLEFCTLFTFYVDSSLTVGAIINSQITVAPVPPGEMTPTKARASSSDLVNLLPLGHEEWRFQHNGRWLTKVELLAMIANENAQEQTTVELPCDRVLNVFAQMNNPGGTSNVPGRAPAHQHQQTNYVLRATFTPTMKQLCALYLRDLIPHALHLCESKSVLPHARKFFQEATSCSSREPSVDSSLSEAGGAPTHQGSAAAKMNLSAGAAAANFADDFTGGMKLLLLVYPYANYHLSVRQQSGAGSTFSASSQSQSGNALQVQLQQNLSENVFIQPIWQEWAMSNQALVEQNIEAYHASVGKLNKAAGSATAASGGGSSSSSSSSRRKSQSGATQDRGRTTGGGGENNNSSSIMDTASPPGGSSNHDGSKQPIVRQIQLPSSWLHSNFPIQEFLLLCLTWHKASFCSETRPRSNSDPNSPAGQFVQDTFVNQLLGRNSSYQQPGTNGQLHQMMLINGTNLLDHHQPQAFLSLNLLLLSLQLLKPLVHARVVLLQLLLELLQKQKLQAAWIKQNEAAMSQQQTSFQTASGAATNVFLSEYLAEYFFRHFFELLLDFFRSAHYEHNDSRATFEHSLLKMLRHSTAAGGSKRGMVRLPRSEKYDSLCLVRYGDFRHCHLNQNNAAAAAGAGLMQQPPGAQGILGSSSSNDEANGQSQIAEQIRLMVLEVLPEPVIFAYGPEELQKILAGTIDNYLASSVLSPAPNVMVRGGAVNMTSSSFFS